MMENFRSTPWANIMGAATPSTRQISSSRIARRSTGVGNSASQKAIFSLEESAISPSLLHISTTSKRRTHIGQSMGKTPVTRRSTVFDTTDAFIFDNTIADATECFLTDDDAAVQVCSRLYHGFLDLYQSHPSEHEIFDLLLRYEQLCSDYAQMLWKILEKTKPVNIRTKMLHEALCQERNTWRLTRVLYQDRLRFDNPSSPGDILMELVGKHYSDSEAINNLYQRDSTVRQGQLVVDWLEKNAQDDFFEKNVNRMEFFLDSHVAWENTLHLLKKSKSGRSLRIADEMDPDAPIRQNRPLVDLDREDEANLMKHMFAFVRAGQLGEAQSLAVKYGSPWLAAALEGWRLHHDPNYNATPQEGGELLPVEGNHNRDIWKSVCWSLMGEEQMTVYERAIYAASSGNLKGMLAVSQSWEDHLWAYMRTFVDIRIEQEILNACPRQRPAIKFPQNYWDRLLTCEQVFQEIEAGPFEVVGRPSGFLHYAVQKHIILDNLSDLIEEMCKQCHDATLHHQVRFCAHFVLFLQMVGLSVRENLCFQILDRYVSILIKEQRIELIASYTATLPPAHQVISYASFLEQVTESGQRQKCLELAEVAGLDVQLITKTVVESIRLRDFDDRTKNDPQLTTETTAGDMLKVEAIDWLVFDPSQRAEAMKQGNALMRMFVASRKVDAARLVLLKLPSDSIFVIENQWKTQIRSDDLPSEESNAVREYLCFQAYLMALEAFDDWFDHYHHSKPSEPKKPIGSGVKFTEWVAYEHRMKQYEADVERWQQSLKAQTKSTTERLYNVLLFPNGGWMADQRAENEIDEGRQQQMALLRRLCIPEITTLLHTILQGTQQYKECMQLADIITDEKNMLYLEFSKQEIITFLTKLRETSVTALDHNLDPLGYPYQ